MTSKSQSIKRNVCIKNSFIELNLKTWIQSQKVQTINQDGDHAHLV